MPWGLNAQTRPAELPRVSGVPPPPLPSRASARDRVVHSSAHYGKVFVKQKEHIVAERITARVPWSRWMQSYWGHERLYVVLRAVGLA